MHLDLLIASGMLAAPMLASLAYSPAGAIPASGSRAVSAQMSAPHPWQTHALTALAAAAIVFSPLQDAHAVS